jgi:hypothetical protein
MTIVHPPAMRRVLAGLTVTCALSVPLGGIAGAESGAERRAPTTTRPVPRVETSAPQPGKGAEDRARIGGTEEAAAGLKAECVAQITRRLGSLAELPAGIAAKADSLEPAHRSAIDAIIADAVAGLTELAAEVDAATTVDVVKPLCRRVVTDFRVYALVVAQVKLVLAADAVTAKEQTFAGLHVTLADAIAKGRTPADGATLDALLASFDAHVAAMLTAVDGVADRALGITVAGYNADPKVLRREVDLMRTAQAEAKAAARDARRILEILKGAAADAPRATQATGARDASAGAPPAGADERPPTSAPRRKAA